MGQRIFPSATDFTQLNSEHCNSLCKNSNLECGMGGFKQGKTGCRTCVCSKYRYGRTCAQVLPGAKDLALTLSTRQTISINVTAPYTPRYSIYTAKGLVCPYPNFELAVRFIFISDSTNLLMHDGLCRDYLSITTNDPNVLPEEVRMCKFIRSPVNNFSIVTSDKIHLMLVRDDYVKRRPAQEIHLSLEGICVNMVTGNTAQMRHVDYLGTENMTTTATVEKKKECDSPDNCSSRESMTTTATVEKKKECDSPDDCSSRASSSASMSSFNMTWLAIIPLLTQYHSTTGF
jgi:hypothetical protein